MGVGGLDQSERRRHNELSPVPGITHGLHGPVVRESASGAEGMVFKSRKSPTSDFVKH